MRVVTPRGLDIYSRCPKRYSFSQAYEPKISVEQRVIEDVIKHMYLFHARKGILIPWRHIPARAHQTLSKLVEGLDTAQEYKQTKDLLAKLSGWYNKHYLEEYCDEGITNLPIRVGLDSNLTLVDKVDIVTMGKQLRLFDFHEIHDSETLRRYTGVKVYNNLGVLSRIWAFYQATEVIPEEYVRLVISNRTVTPVKIRITQQLVGKTEKIVRQLTRGIKDNVFYPSFSEQCLYCPFKDHCSV